MDVNQPLMSRNRDEPELYKFYSLLKWLCVDQSTHWTACLSWVVFILFAVVVPALSYFFLCETLCDRPFDIMAQLSLSFIASLSFICLSNYLRMYGRRRFLFFDKLKDESHILSQIPREKYFTQLKFSINLLFILVLPFFVAGCAYKIWWYRSRTFVGNVTVITVMWILDVSSRLYRTVIFFLVCVLFRMACCLHILLLQYFEKLFAHNTDLAEIIDKDKKIRLHLTIICRRYRIFVLLALFIFIVSQFLTLIMTTRANADVNIYHTGELAVSSFTLLVGILILLESGTKVRKAHDDATSQAAKWHVTATNHDDAPLEEGKLTSSAVFQERQALVTYFENNRTGITMYGIMVDKSSMSILFWICFCFVLWLVGKTLFIS